MKKRFKETFDKISTEYSIVFRKMFKGGNGVLKLTDENDLLNTGISILAVPPGKKLNSTSMLSGGEKALTAICLIFAILNVKPAPFIVLDEEKAYYMRGLKEYNRDRKYLIDTILHFQDIYNNLSEKLLDYNV